MLRLIIAIVFVLLSLLCVFKAPAYPLWFAAILVEEFPWMFIIIGLLLMLWGIQPQRYQMLATALSLIGIVMYFIPIVGAYRIARSLPEDLQKSFLGSAPSREPFKMLKMISRSGEKVSYTTMTYYENSNDSLKLDFYRAVVQGARPCVVVIHGGSWAGGDRQQLPELNSVLAVGGYNVATIDYGLVPKHLSPEPKLDVQRALAFLRKNCQRLNIDTSRFVLLGRSAGGQIALTAAYENPDPGIRGVVGFYAPADMTWGYTQPSNKLIMDSKKVMEDYLGGTYDQHPEKYIESTSTNFVTPSTVPTLLIHGDNDALVFHEHSVRLSKKLTENHVKHYLLTLPWATHGADYTLNGPSGQLSTYSVLYFLNEIVGT